MKKKSSQIFHFSISVVLSASIFCGFQFKWGPLPPLGRFLSPQKGLWQNLKSESTSKDFELAMQVHSKSENDANGSFRVNYDNRGVPHIFASSDESLAYAQGFVTARDRLWQMELQVRATAGRLSEIIGPAVLAHDIQMRKLGLTWAAEKSLAEMLSNNETKIYVESYARGVNAYIESLQPEQLPIEYKILDYKPEPWSPIKTVLLIKQMAWDLSGKSDDLRMSNNLNKHGIAVLENLFPDFNVNTIPVIPKGTKWNNSAKQPELPLSPFLPPAIAIPKFFEPNLSNGSNNWAVSSEKSSTSFPILANDPHLGLRLPSIWYEVQLHSPTVNVYGVSIPGAPGVIIGFNNDVAWGVTNSGADATDWFQVKFNNETKSEYFYNKKWNPVLKRSENVIVKGQESVKFDVPYTHHGPVAFEVNHLNEPNSELLPLAFRWIAHEPSNELLAFYKLNRARNLENLTEALQIYKSPAQNFALITRAGDVALWHNGLLPLRWKGQGKFILDGTSPEHDWAGWIPKPEVPHVNNPASGIVSSANQFATDGSYPYWLVGNWNATSDSRAVRIGELLSENKKYSPDDMQNMQLDNFDKQAQLVMPTLLSKIILENLNDVQKTSLAYLKDWKYFNNANEVAPALYRKWWNKIQDSIWEDEFDPSCCQRPYSDRTIRLILEEPNSNWFDNINTPEKETLSNIINSSFAWAVDSLATDFGKENIKNWTLGKTRGTNFRHLARIPGLGIMGLHTGGAGTSINATKENHGPSWRMVVTFDNSKVIGKGIYPGGQSGVPGNVQYDNFISAWENGKLDDLIFYSGPTDQNINNENAIEYKKEGQ